MAIVKTFVLTGTPCGDSQVLIDGARLEGEMSRFAGEFSVDGVDLIAVDASGIAAIAPGACRVLLTGIMKWWRECDDIPFLFLDAAPDVCTTICDRISRDPVLRQILPGVCLHDEEASLPAGLPKKLTAVWFALETGDPGGSSAKDLAEKIGDSVGSCSVYLAKLYKMGLLGRRKQVAGENGDRERGWTYIYRTASQIYRE